MIIGNVGIACGDKTLKSASRASAYARSKAVAKILQLRALVFAAFRMTMDRQEYGT